MSAQVLTRKDVLKLTDWDPIILWYAKAVADLKTRPLNDPTSWRYQAAIHDYDPNSDPLAKPSDVPPSTADQKKFWKQCQHFSWFFLSWHRIYLHFFEQTVRASVVHLGGPANWTLPYWNYSDTTNPNALRIPPSFRAANLPDGTPNPLQIQARIAGANTGQLIGSSAHVDLRTCLREGSFIAAPPGGAPGFGGPPTLFNHSRGDAGAVENVPHGAMHMAVGGVNPRGWMSSFNTAPLDPLFWLHHCNIDRLWEVWRKRNPAHTNPNEPAWLTNIRFDFHNASGAAVTMTSSQVVDTTAAPLLYKYEDVSDPLPPAPPTEAARMRDMEDARLPEMVGATDQPLTLTSEAATAVVPVTRPTGPASGRESGAPARVFLNVENITSAGQPGSYLVYVNLPPNANPTEYQELCAGLLAMFGVEESTAPSDEHPANGVHYRLEITDVVQELERRNDWNAQEMRVTFVPSLPPNARESGAVGAPVQVGRVSVYYS